RPLSPLYRVSGSLYKKVRDFPGSKMYKQGAAIRYTVMRKLLAITLLVAVVPLAASQSIGMAPSSYQVSGVEPGESIDFTVYLTLSGTDRNVTVQPKVLPAKESAIFNGDDVIDEDAYSEQEVNDWVQWDSQSYELSPGSQETYQLPNGDTVVANGRMSGTLQVPDNAEPGYHAFQLGVNPQFSQASGFGATVYGVTRTRYVFRVSGDATRKIEVSGVSARRVGEQEVQFVFELENTGTVTTSVTGGGFSIIGSDGNKVGASRVGATQIPPGSTREVETRWVKNNLEGGNYRLRGSADYRTGEAFFDETVTITQAPRDPIQVDNPDQQEGSSGPQQASAPLLLILVAVLGTGSVLYAFGLDMLWALLLAGFAGIAIFIITSGLPVYVLALMLMGAGAVVYLNW
ncbi:MAG: hypothetical protein ABEJ99_00905, partial [Candidatus Nanohaloarchaea archaeon]